MKLATLFFSACLSTLAAARGEFECGTGEPPWELLHDPEMEAEFASGNATLETRQIANIEVDTFVHIVTSPEKEGKYTFDSIVAQIDVLNRSFRGTGFSFRFVGLDFTVEEKLATDFDAIAGDLRRRLRSERYSEMNLFFFSDFKGGLLGQASLPSNVGQFGRDAYFYDTVENHADTMPGVSTPYINYDQGITAVHEAGHWLGLSHTFRGYSCDPNDPGDMVADTAQHSTPSYRCPVGKDTCPNVPGLDPIHNYMDYTYDSCLEEFSPGQAGRMQTAWTRFRAGK